MQRLLAGALLTAATSVGAVAANRRGVFGVNKVELQSKWWVKGHSYYGHRNIVTKPRYFWHTLEYEEIFVSDDRDGHWAPYPAFVLWASPHFSRALRPFEVEKKDVK